MENNYERLQGFVPAVQLPRRREILRSRKPEGSRHSRKTSQFGLQLQIPLSLHSKLAKEDSGLRAHTTIRLWLLNPN